MRGSGSRQVSRAQTGSKSLEDTLELGNTRGDAAFGQLDCKGHTVLRTDSPRLWARLPAERPGCLRHPRDTCGLTVVAPAVPTAALGADGPGGRAQEALALTLGAQTHLLRQTAVTGPGVRAWAPECHLPAARRAPPVTVPHLPLRPPPPRPPRCLQVLRPGGPPH